MWPGRPRRTTVSWIVERNDLELFNSAKERAMKEVPR
jgi:hypothetical protein